MKEVTKLLPLVNTVNPSLRLRPDQVWPTLSERIQAEGHHIIGHGGI